MAVMTFIDIVYHLWYYFSGIISSYSATICTFSQGMVDLRVWPNQIADGNFPTKTPGKGRDHGKEQMQRLAKVSTAKVFERVALQLIPGLEMEMFTKRNALPSLTC